MEKSEYEVDNGILFSFIRICAICSGIFLITVLKPHRLYKKFLTSFLNYSFNYIYFLFFKCKVLNINLIQLIHIKIN